MIRFIYALTLVFLCFLCASAEPRLAISGYIRDSEGAAIANAEVLVHWDPSGSAVTLRDNVGAKQDVMVATDASGHYSANVPPGFYDVFVSAMAFTPTAAKVRVKEGQAAILSPKLSADPLVTKELGDDIYPGLKPQAYMPESPVVKSAGMPLYPQLARLARIEGSVRVEVTTNGTATVKVLASGAHKLLMDAAQENVKTWCFYRHKPQTFTVTFIYKLEPPEVYGTVNPTITLNLPNLVEIRTKIPTVETYESDAP